MKRGGLGARDSPTKDRYAGKRQTQAGRGGRRQKPGSRDVSPAPPAWPAIQSSNPATAAHPPALSAHQLAVQQQHLAETAAKTPAHELIAQIKRLTLPTSCTFVLGLLEKYVKAYLTSDAMLKISLPKKIPLLTLVNYFILCQPVLVKTVGKKNKTEMKPAPYSPLEELQVMVSVVRKIEEQANIDQQFYMFEAIFGGCIGTIKTGSKVGESFLERVVCLAVSLQSSKVLSCVALWMQVYPSEALSLSHSLYSSFCEQLPNASEPLVQVASLCPQLAYQLASSFTNLHPFHIIGTPVPGVDPGRLCPPQQLLSILSHWVEKTPGFLYAPRLMDKTDFITFHGASSKSSSVQSASPGNRESPLAGLMRWCILAPCYHHPEHSPEELKKKSLVVDKKVESFLETTLKGLSIASPSIGGGSLGTSGKEGEGKDKKSSHDEDFRTLVSQLHANILSVILSDSQSFPRDTLTSDHIAVTVAALLGLSRHQPAQLKKRGKGGGGAAVVGEERNQGEKLGENQQELEESVERLAQFLQISLSTGLLVLSSENLSSMASTLPVNKLLSLVISHNSSRR